LFHLFAHFSHHYHYSVKEKHTVLHDSVETYSDVETSISKLSSEDSPKYRSKTHYFSDMPPPDSSKALHNGINNLVPRKTDNIPPAKMGLVDIFSKKIGTEVDNQVGLVGIFSKKTATKEDNQNQAGMVDIFNKESVMGFVKNVVTGYGCNSNTGHTGSNESITESESALSSRGSLINKIHAEPPPTSLLKLVDCGRASTHQPPSQSSVSNKVDDDLSSKPKCTLPSSPQRSTSQKVTNSVISQILSHKSKGEFKEGILSFSEDCSILTPLEPNCGEGGHSKKVKESEQHQNTMLQRSSVERKRLDLKTNKSKSEDSQDTSKILADLNLSTQRYNGDRPSKFKKPELKRTISEETDYLDMLMSNAHSKDEFSTKAVKLSKTRSDQSSHMSQNRRTRRRNPSRDALRNIAKIKELKELQMPDTENGGVSISSVNKGAKLIAPLESKEGESDVEKEIAAFKGKKSMKKKLKNMFSNGKSSYKQY